MFSLLLSYCWAIQLRYIPGIYTSSISSACSTISEKVDVTSSLTTLYQNVYIFWWHMFFKNGINIYSKYYFLHMVHQSTSSSVLNIFSFLFPQAFYLTDSSLFNFRSATSSLRINFIITRQLDFPLSWALNLLRVFKFPTISRRFLDTLNDDYRV